MTTIRGTDFWEHDDVIDLIADTLAETHDMDVSWKDYARVVFKALHEEELLGDKVIP